MKRSEFVVPITRTFQVVFSYNWSLPLTYIKPKTGVFYDNHMHPTCMVKYLYL